MMHKLKYYILLFLIVHTLVSKAQIPWTVDVSSNDTCILIFDANTFQTGGNINLKIGDGLGAFFLSNNQLYCAGYIEWNNTVDTLKILGMDAQSFGLNEDDTIYLRHWDVSESCNHDVSSISFEDENFDSFNTLLFKTSRIFNTFYIEGTELSFNYLSDSLCFEKQTQITPIINDSSTFQINKDYLFSSEPSNLPIDTDNGILSPTSSDTGHYTITLETSYCIDTKEFDIQLTSCEKEQTEEKAPIFFSLEQDPEPFPITDTVKVRVYDLRGRMVNELNAPIEWDGTDMNGDFLPTGLYFIFFDNKKKYEITIIR